MRATSLYPPQLRLRPISERPEGEIVTAIVFQVDDTEGPDSINVTLADEIFVWVAADEEWTGELSGNPPPRTARWYLPEAELTAVPTACAARDAAAQAPASPAIDPTDSRWEGHN